MPFQKALIIDDDDVDLYVSKRVLKDSDFAKVVHTASTSDEAMEYMAASNVEDLPGIIFLDLNMPGKNGLDFLREYALFAIEKKVDCIVALLMNIVNSEDTATAEASKHPLVRYVIEKPLTQEKLKSISVPGKG